jgi:ABC-2 type transport system ATP-binding protein
MSIEPALSSSPAPAGASHIVLKVTELSKHFGGIAAVAGLSLEIRQGEVFGLLGPNGAGKSTMINMICGLLAPDAGTISLFGEIVRPGADVIPRRVGVCPQDIVIWNKLTCLEQLEFVGILYGLARAAARRRGISLLADLGLSEKTDRLAGTLSGGMKRRLNLALALVHDPDFVVLDEPEAGLDPQSRVLVREYIRAMARRKTVLFTTHNMDEAERVCDRVAIIDHGSLLVLDTPARLKQTSGSGGILEIEMDVPETAEAALPELAGLGLQGVRVGCTLIIRGADGAEVLPVLLARLKSRGAAVREARHRENTLEDVFIALTGRRLRE